MKDKKQRRGNDRRNQRKNDRSKDRRKETETVETEENNFVFGHHASVEALQAGRGNKLFMQEDARGDKIEQLKALAKEQAVPVKWVPKQKLDTLSDGGVHQGIVLGITPYEYLTLEDLLAKNTSEAAPFLLILDSLEDPHNFGRCQWRVRRNYSKTSLSRYYTSCDEGFDRCSRIRADCSSNEFGPKY